jgi:hypothetical protein
MVLPQCSQNRLHSLLLFAKVAKVASDHESLARVYGHKRPATG